MYTTAVKGNFIASHFLVGGEWGRENKLHSHHYEIEVELEGEKLDSHGFLVDITEIELALTRVLGYFQDRTLNELAEFKHLNPSVENFARILNLMISDRINVEGLSSLRITIWESKTAWASFRKDF